MLSYSQTEIGDKMIKGEIGMVVGAGLSDPQVAAVLDELHAAARGDLWVFARAAPSVLWQRLRGVPLAVGVSAHMDKAYIPVPREVGSLLYLTALANGAKRVAEFGTSFGISAIYLAAAMRETGGHFIGTEKVPDKAGIARANLARAGLSNWAEVREGDAMQTLAAVEGPIDLVLLDGWKDLYLPVLELLKPRLRPGSVVMADNIHTFRKDLAPYVAHMRDPANGFRTTTLPIGSGVEYSVYWG